MKENENQQENERTLGWFIHRVTASEKLVSRLSNRKRRERLFSPSSALPPLPLSLPSLLDDDEVRLYHC